MTLNETEKSLAIKTDKGCERPDDHNYLTCYERYTGPIKDTVKSVLELGIWMGGSLLLWTEYFKNAKIYGIDFSQQWIDLCDSLVNKDRVTLYKGDYSDKPFMESTLDPISPIDIIIEDGHHIHELQSSTLRLMCKYLSKDGYYFMEDVIVGRDGCPRDTKLDSNSQVAVAIRESNMELIEEYWDPNTPGYYSHLLVLKRRT